MLANFNLSMSRGLVSLVNHTRPSNSPNVVLPVSRLGRISDKVVAAATWMPYGAALGDDGDAPQLASGLTLPMEAPFVLPMEAPLASLVV